MECLWKILLCNDLDFIYDITAAATIPQQYINEEVRKQLFIASIIFGFIHLIFEIRQFLYNITKWFYNFWNIFGKYKCLI